MSNPKKPQSPEFKRRSRAAKKGWKTRYKNQIRGEEKLLTNAKIAKVGIKKARKKPNPRIETDGMTSKQLRAALEDERKKRIDTEAALAVEIATNGFVDSRQPEYLHRDFSIAAHPCRLRHLVEAPKLRKALIKAHQLGERHLARIATDMADYYDIPVKEVYTLFWSA